MQSLTLQISTVITLRPMLLIFPLTPQPAGLASGRAFNDTVTTTTAKTYAEVAAVAGLLDNPAKYTITSAAASAGEGDAITFTVTLDSAPTEAVTVSYVTGNGSTDSADFTQLLELLRLLQVKLLRLSRLTPLRILLLKRTKPSRLPSQSARLNSSVQAVGTITNDDVNPNSVVQAFTLTTGSESLTGKDGDDTFTAADGTLSSLDTLAGGSGSDTLTAVLTGDTINLNSTSVEQLNFSNTGVSTVNLESASGVTGVKVSDMTASAATTITLENIQAAIALTFANFRIDGADEHNTVAVDFDGAAISGTSDDVLFTLDDVLDAELTLTREGTNTVETVSLHTVNEASTIEHFVTTGVGATTLEITGDQALTISGNAATTSLDSEIVTVSGADASGAITLTATGGNTSVSITTGSGADAVTGGTADDTFVTGAGADTVTASGGDDTITSGDGADSVLGGDGADSVIAGAGADTINAGAGDDIVDGGQVLTQSLPVLAVIRLLVVLVLILSPSLPML